MFKALCALLFCLAVFHVQTAFADSYDAFSDYVCDAAVSSAWSYDGYRAGDGKYLEMVFGRPPLTEVSKYGVEAHYIPDGEQTYYPFITRFPDGLWGSPATAGKRFDAVLTWISPGDSDARFTGSVTLKGNLKGEASGRKIRALLVQGATELWSADIAGGQTAKFDVTSAVRSGDRVHLHLVNAGDDSGNMALFGMIVNTGS